MTGKVGSGDPAYTALRTDLQLLSTKIMQAHVGSRGSQGMLEHFKALADGGQMDSATLKAAIATEYRYVHGIARYPVAPTAKAPTAPTSKPVNQLEGAR
jgi:hypothetical protein